MISEEENWLATLMLKLFKYKLFQLLDIDLTNKNYFFNGSNNWSA